MGKTGTAAGTPPGAAVAIVVVALVTCAVALLAGGGSPRAVPDGLPGAGAPTGWALPLVGLLGRLAAVGVVGSLLVAAVLVPARPDGRCGAPASRAGTCAGRWAAAWSLLAVVELVLLARDVAGVPLGELDPGLLRAVLSSTPGRALGLVAVVAAVLSVLAPPVRTRGAARGLLAAAVLVLAPGAAAGHASASADTDVTASALVVHVVAATLWVGGLAALALLLRGDVAALQVAAPRFSALALGAYVALAGSGVIAVVAELGTSPATWAGGYGALVLAKVLVLLLLGAVGHTHRRRTIPRLGTPAGHRAFLRLAAAELVLMGAATGLAVALSRTPLPTPAAVAAPGHGPGHAGLPVTVEPISVDALATAWRPNAVVLVVLALSLAGYLRGVRVLRARGCEWPRVRTCAFVAGVVVAGTVLCSGVALYALATVSVQVSQLLVTLLVVPALLLLGAPVRLYEQQGGTLPRGGWAGRAGRLAVRPVGGAGATCLLVLAVYRTPLIELSQRSPTVHLVVLALALGCGLLLLWPSLGGDRAGAPGDTEEQGWSLVAVAACLGLLAGQLRYGDRLLAGDWFLELRWSWVDPVADQHLAAGVLAGAAGAVLVLALVLVVRDPARSAVNDAAARA